MAADPSVRVRRSTSPCPRVDVEALLADLPVLLLRWDDDARCTTAEAPGHRPRADPRAEPGETAPPAEPADTGGTAGDPDDDRVGDLAAALAGEGWMAAVHPDDQPRATALVRAALGGERGGAQSVRLSSGRRWAVLRVEPDPAGGAHGALVGASQSAGDTARLARLTDGLNRLRRPEEIVRFVLDEGLALLGGVTASIHVLSDRGDGLVLAGAAGVPEDVLTQGASPLSLDVPLPATEALRTGEMVVVQSPEERRARYPQLDEVLPLEYTPAFVVVPLRDAQGQPFGVLSVGLAEGRTVPEAERAFLLDVAAHCELAIDRARMTAVAERNQQRLTFLNEINEELSGSFELERTLRRLTEMCVPRLADWCVVRVGGRGTRGESHPVVGAAHVEPALAGELARLALDVPRDLGGSGPLAEALVRGEPLVRTSSGAEAFGDLFGEGGEDRLAAVGVEAVALFPLTARDRLLGAVAFGNRSGRPLGEADLDLMGSVAARAATLVDNARLFQQQAAVARSLQDSLLPGSLPEIPGLELGARYRPAGRGLEVGGDFYDAFRADANWWIVAVGDVCGHGVEAAAMTGLVRHTIRARAMVGAMPSVILDRLNEMLLRQAAERSAAAARRSSRPARGSARCWWGLSSPPSTASTSSCAWAATRRRSSSGTRARSCRSAGRARCWGSPPTCTSSTRSCTSTRARCWCASPTASPTAGPRAARSARRAWPPCCGRAPGCRRRRWPG